MAATIDVKKLRLFSAIQCQLAMLKRRLVKEGNAEIRVVVLAEISAYEALAAEFRV